MKRIIAIIALAAWVAPLGCSQDFYAEKIVESKTSPPNRVWMGLVGSGQQLQAQGIIDLQRRFDRPDDTKIDTWVINAKTKPASGTVILLHGEGECKANYLDIGKNLAKMGYDVVLIDLRSHGQSTGKYITLGAKEKLDVQAIVNTLAREKKILAKPLYVFGVTFGAATALQYAAIEPEVAGVVVVAPWKDAVSVARRKLFLAGLNMKPGQLREVFDRAGKLADFDLAKTSAFNDAAKLKCPVYIIHGLFDMAVPLDDSKAILAQLKGPKKLDIILPGAQQIAVGLGWKTWVPQQIDMVAKGKLTAKADKTKKPGPARPKNPAANTPAK
jgi:pimeloyl-ACP methyl ester carboxylesterase